MNGFYKLNNRDEFISKDEQEELKNYENALRSQVRFD